MLKQANLAEAWIPARSVHVCQSVHPEHSAAAQQPAVTGQGLASAAPLCPSTISLSGCISPSSSSGVWICLCNAEETDGEMVNKFFNLLSVSFQTD